MRYNINWYDVFQTKNTTRTSLKFQKKNNHIPYYTLVICLFICEWCFKDIFQNGLLCIAKVQKILTNPGKTKIKDRIGTAVVFPITFFENKFNLIRHNIYICRYSPREWNSILHETRCMKQRRVYNKMRTAFSVIL